MSEVDHKLRVASEGLARKMDRRGFLQTAGSAIFAGVAALAAGHALGGSALAAQTGRRIPHRPRCAPPSPYFCNIDGNNEPNGCHGAQCFQHRSGSTVYQCKIYYQFYAAGCWTTVDGGGYWTCCDCTCGAGGVCGCAQYSTGPVPLPAGQG
ncbi:MAG TPA: hypothetical protein VEX13_11980 [Chloroflexia bacterium]|nr:hypothetical protein [Chloroflexia bacterium]